MGHSKTAEISQYSAQMDSAKSEIERFRQKHQESERVRKHSISTLHDNLFAKLLEAEAEHEEMVNDYKARIDRLEVACETHKESMSVMANQKVDTIRQLDGTISELRQNLSAEAEKVRLL